MKNGGGLYCWMVKNLEQPMLEAELVRAEISSGRGIDVAKIKKITKKFYVITLVLSIPVVLFLTGSL